MNQTMNPKKKKILDEVHTEELPAQEKLTLDAQDAAMLPAGQVYAQRLNETLPDGNLSAPTFVP